MNACTTGNAILWFRVYVTIIQLSKYTISGFECEVKCSVSTHTSNELKIMKLEIFSRQNFNLGIIIGDIELFS